MKGILKENVGGTVNFGMILLWRVSSRNLTFQKNVFIFFIDSPSKMMKNAFYYILKALFVLKIFKFLSWLFEHAWKTVWLER